MTQNKHTWAYAFTLFFSLFSTVLPAQDDVRTCHMTHLHEQHLAENPQLRIDNQAFEAEVRRYMQAGGLQVRGALTIPVVVHIIYSNANENITDEQVYSQIDAMNRDFNKANSDLKQTPSLFSDVVANCGISFQLATRDPEGKATTGIKRYSSPITMWGISDDIKKPAKGGVEPWAAQRYLNIYVANLASKSLGFSSFPGAADNVDGVVISYKAFGTMGTAASPYNMGRTCVHEIGHWLGLYHIWGDADCGDDRVDDTPTHKKQNGGCPNYPQVNNCNGVRTIEMTMNFMDYTYDNCMYMFTEGQKARMWATIEKRRPGLLISEGVQPAANRICAMKPVELKKVESTFAMLKWDAIAGVAKYTIEYRALGQPAWAIETSVMPYLQIDSLKKGVTYEVRVKTDCVNAGYSNILKFTTSLEDSKFADLEPKEILTAVPNPVMTTTQILVGGDLTKPFTMSVYDANGLLKSTESHKTDTPSVFLDFSNYPQGVYFIVMVKNGFRTVKKVVH